VEHLRPLITVAPVVSVAAHRSFTFSAPMALDPAARYCARAGRGSAGSTVRKRSAGRGRNAGEYHQGHHAPAADDCGPIALCPRTYTIKKAKNTHKPQSRAGRCLAMGGNRWSVRHSSVAQGFGSTLLEAAIASDLAVKPRLSFNPDGFVYELDAPLHVLTGGQAP
jgi:hypothetical protein